MKFTRYTIIPIIICIVLIIVIWLHLSKCDIIEGVENKETIDAKKTASINDTVIRFTQDLYDKMVTYISSKTQESESKSDEILKRIDEKTKNIENSNQVDPEELKRWQKMKKLITAKKIKFHGQNNMKSNPGITLEILTDKEREKVRGVINKYI